MNKLDDNITQKILTTFVVVNAMIITALIAYSYGLYKEKELVAELFKNSVKTEFIIPMSDEQYAGESATGRCLNLEGEAKLLKAI
jgi:hypothetical protein